MQFLCIGVNDSPDDVTKHIINELKQVKTKEIKYSVKNEVNSSGSASIICSINEDKVVKNKAVHSYDVLRIHVSNALADYIIHKYEEKLIMRVINSNYCYFNSMEKKEILNTALRIIRNSDGNIFDSLFEIRRRNVIVRKLLDYFDGENNLILDGFINFRLKEYIKDLEEIVDRAVDDFLMEREYREFIRLLRYFVEIQDPKFSEIHVIVCERGYILLDEDRNEITNECIEEFANEIPEGEINCDDLLVSSLITLAPKRVLIHGMEQFKNKELLETIKNVFLGKVIICNGCKICSVHPVKV